MNKLKPYMAHGGEPQEGAGLAFAHSLKEAKKVAWDAHSFLHDILDGEYTNLRVVWLRHDHGYLLETEADKAKLANDEAHFIESPTTCKSCELWGYELDENGYCESCADDIEPPMEETK